MKLHLSPYFSPWVDFISLMAGGFLHEVGVSFWQPCAPSLASNSTSREGKVLFFPSFCPSSPNQSKKKKSSQGRTVIGPPGPCAQLWANHCGLGAGSYDCQLPPIRVRWGCGGVFPRRKELLFWRVNTTNIHEKLDYWQENYKRQKRCKNSQRSNNQIARTKYSISFGNTI